MRFDREILELAAPDAQQVVVFLPAGEYTTAAVNQLRNEHETSLRAV